MIISGNFITLWNYNVYCSGYCRIQTITIYDMLITIGEYDFTNFRKDLPTFKLKLKVITRKEKRTLANQDFSSVKNPKS